jgi:hypothetical protein
VCSARGEQVAILRIQARFAVALSTLHDGAGG